MPTEADPPLQLRQVPHSDAASARVDGENLAKRRQSHRHLCQDSSRFQTISVAMVLVNTLQLLFGFTSLPNVVQYSVEVLHSRRHTFGIVGALVENTIIL